MYEIIEANSVIMKLVSRELVSVEENEISGFKKGQAKRTGFLF